LKLLVDKQVNRVEDVFYSFDHPLGFGLGVGRVGLEEGGELG